LCYSRQTNARTTWRCVTKRVVRGLTTSMCTDRTFETTNHLEAPVRKRNAYVIQYIMSNSIRVISYSAPAYFWKQFPDRTFWHLKESFSQNSLSCTPPNYCFYHVSINAMFTLFSYRLAYWLALILVLHNCNLHPSF
jgi:hypothetical protein